MISTLKEIETESTGSFPWVIHGTARQNVNKRHFSLMKNMTLLYPNMENVGENLLQLETKVIRMFPKISLVESAY